MSWHRQLLLNCDEPPECEEELDVMAATVGELREAAHRQGWTTVGGKDYCPYHTSDDTELDRALAGTDE